MEESFELLSSMSPKVKGLQKTIKVKKVSKLALKKHFRRSSAFDKVLPINNEDLEIQEAKTESTESISSFEEPFQNEGKIVINSTDTEKEFLPTSLPSATNEQTVSRIKQWLNNVEEEKKCETFFSQVSTIFGDDAPSLEKDGDKIAASSSFNGYLTRRFDELFIDKKNDGTPLPIQNEDEDAISDASFHLEIDTSSASKLKRFNSDENIQDKLNAAKDLEEKNINKKNNVDEIFLLSDDSDQEASPKRSSPKRMPKDMGFVSARKKNDKILHSTCPATPASQDIEEVASMLDSLYGKKWRQKQENVLLPMSEPRKKTNKDKIPVSNSGRNLKPDVTPNVKRLNLEKLGKSVQSPWIEKSKAMVKTRLNFDEDSPLEDKLKTKKNNLKTYKGSNKENRPELTNHNTNLEKELACSNFLDGKTFPKQKKDEDVICDESFSLGIDTSLTSRLKQFDSDKSKQDKPNVCKKSEKGDNKKDFNEILLTSDESDQEASPRKCFVSVRKKNEYLGTPANQNIEEVASVLDSLYGKKWRQNHDNVLLPMSEPKKTNNDKIPVSNSERKLKPANVMPDKTFNVKRLNFEKLVKPVQSPWIERLKGLVDSDSEKSTGDDNANTGFEKSRGIEMVKTRLNFDEDSPLEDKLKTKKNLSHKTGKAANSNKVNRTDLASNNKNSQKKPTTNRNPPNKEKTKKNTKVQSRTSSSTNSCSEDDISTDEEYDKKIEILEISRRKSMMPTKNRTYSFLESLSGCVPISKCDMSARIFRSNFKQHRDELLKKLFTLYNEKVFDNAIPADSELEWNDKLRKTAGLCYCKRITHRNGNVERKVKISLAMKVLDSPDRLRDTLIHEMCHAATWVVNQVSDGHGNYWKSWAFKAMDVFPELPPIKRCHSYEINSKYTYRCTSCGYSFGRHSKSLDTERKRCGICYGKFEVLLNKTSKKGETKTVPVTPRKEATGFALFVKQNYAHYKDPTKKHGEIMKMLGQKFAELKIKNTS